MKRHGSIAAAVGVLLFAAALLAGNGKSYAQQSEVDNIKAAIASFHDALSSLDISKMEPLWAHDGDVMLINPRDKSISVGWDAVRKNWETTFNFWAQLKVTQAQGPFIRVNGNTAWSAGVANVEGKSKSGTTVNAPTFETDVFERRDGAWLVVFHTASRVFR